MITKNRAKELIDNYKDLESCNISDEDACFIRYYIRKLKNNNFTNGKSFEFVSDKIISEYNELRRDKTIKSLLDDHSKMC